MPSRSRRCGDSGPCRSPTTLATTAWMRSPPTFLRTHRPALRSRDFRWADTSRSTMLRQAPARVSKLALLDTSARPETPEQSERRKPQIALAQGGRFDEVPALQFPIFVHRNRQDDAALRARVRTMAEETGAEAFLRQQKAIMTRPDVAAAAGRDRVSDAGAGRRWRRAHAAAAVARRSPPASPDRGSSSLRIADTSRPWSGRMR